MLALRGAKGSFHLNEEIQDVLPVVVSPFGADVNREIKRLGLHQDKITFTPVVKPDAIPLLDVYLVGHEKREKKIRVGLATTCSRSLGVAQGDSRGSPFIPPPCMGLTSTSSNTNCAGPE